KGQHLTFYNVFKTGKGRDDFSGQFPQYFDGTGIVPQTFPIILLTGSETFSAGNYFVYMMKNLPNVITVGERTGGGGGAVNDVKLPNSWLFSYTWFKSYSAKGENMEFGAAPDCKVKVSYKIGLEKDSVILKALEVLDSINNVF
ncbi:MAG: peptidase S41, partial [Prevotellaceae bacterium]|nr:peptidase S41 [Prevotellaceae bacterium]